MGVSKVTLNGVTLMDVTDKTVDTDNLLTGNTALRNDGETITGAVVTAPASDVSPNMDGTASAGVASTYSRGDHAHPSDTSRQVKITASGILKGDGSGNITSATAGTDYAAASHTQALSTITDAEDLQAIEALSGTSGLLKKTGANTWTLDTTTYIPSSQKGANSGVAELDSSGKVPTSQLPSYVDDVMEYSSISDFPATGETGKIYVDTTTNLVYRWGGSEYVEISGGLALGETSSTAYRGDRGKTAYDHATDASRLTTAQNSGLYKIATTSEGHVASVTAVEKADITGLGIPAQDTTYVFDGTYNASINKAATVSTVTNAINALDGGTIGVGSTNKTITSLSQTDGNISATFDAINITKSQVSDFPTEMTPSSHVHGNITNDGDITTTATIAAGDRLVINDESASKVTNSSITFGTSETTFLTNKGTWATPSGTYSLPTASADTLGGIKVGTNLSISDGVLSATDTTYVFDGTYNASTNKAATVSTVTNAINALDGGTIGTGSTTKTITSLSQTNGNVSATFENIAFPVTSVNTKTGAVSLTAGDVGALPDTTEIPTATSDLTNDSNFVSDASYVHTDNNFTTTLKDKLDGIAAGATVDDHKWNNVSLNKSLSYNDSAFVPYISSTTQKNAYLLDATSTPTSDAIARYSNTAFLSSTTPAANDSSTKVATTAFVSNAISSLGSVLDFKGTKETASQLPTTGNETGDVWIVTADSSEYVWDGTSWEKFGPTIDLSGYVPTSRTVNGKALSADISLTASDVGAATSSDISSAINALDGGTIGTGGASKTITALSQSDGNVNATFNDIAIAWSQVTSGNDDLKAIENLSGTSGLLKKTAANTWSLDTTSYVPTSRKINTKALSGDITLTASDVGALPDDTEIPSATSDLTNDSGFITSADVPTASSTSPKMDGTATVGTEAKWAHGDHIHPTDTSRQEKITASGILKGNGSGTISAAVAGTDYQAPLPSQTGNNGKYLTTNGTVLSWGDVDALPSQTGQSGKYLTTNGTTASWSSVDALPSQTGQSGKYLTTNGTSASWSSISIPTATSDLTNDSGFITSADIPVTSVNNQTGDIVLTASDIGALPDSTVVPVINIVTNPALTASSGKFTWTISASSAGGDMNPNIVITIYELSTGAVIYPNIIVNQSTGNITITINGTGTLAANTYKAVIIA